MPDADERFRDLNAELDQLRASLIELRRLLASQKTPSPSALEAANRQRNSIKTLIRLLQTDAAAAQSRLERAERETWEHKVKRADATARLKNRERLLDQIQRSTVWKAVKPLWKLFNRSRKSERETKILSGDLAFALDLPNEWKTNREVLLIKGWCFSRSGRQIAGVRAKIGRKGRLARYGLERTDVARDFADWPAARQSGFTVEIRVPHGPSTIRLEAIEQGSEWQPFFEHELEGEGKGENSDGQTDSPDAPAQSYGTERISKLPALSANKAFQLLESPLRKHARRVTHENPLFSVLTPT